VRSAVYVIRGAGESHSGAGGKTDIMSGVRTLNLLSVVVPVYNESDNLPHLYDRLADTIGPMGCDWELVIVDDGSQDGTDRVLRELHARDARVNGIVLTRNFGHEAACTAGLDAARGDAAVLMDGDLQDPPELIPELVEQWRDGYDIVSAVRTSRSGDSISKRFLAYTFYRVMQRLVRWDFPQDIGNFRLMDRVALDALRRCPERNRFVRALTAWTGFRQTAVPFAREMRHAGRSKYSIRKILGLALTSITGYSNDPLRIASIIGLIFISGSLIATLVLALTVVSGRPVSWGPLILVSIWFVGGLQCLLLGLLGEYVGRIYTESRSRPVYFVQEIIGRSDPQSLVRR
jgi:polyisoprenyl-phosphate glycosyltransferase